MRSVIESTVIAAASSRNLHMGYALARTLTSVVLVGGMLWLASVSNASATSTSRAETPTPADLLDIYMGVVNMNRCCDCHTIECR